MTDSQRWLTLAGLLVAGGVLYLLAPVLTPFAVAALLAYMGDPLVDKLEQKRLSRTGAVVAVFLIIFTLILMATIVLVPLLEQQIVALVRRLPGYLDWAQTHLVPALMTNLGVDREVVALTAVKDAVVRNWQQAGGILVRLVADVSKSGAAVAGWAANVVLVPVVTFYLLRDWDLMVARVHELIPRPFEAGISRLAKDCDSVLAEFFRGQILVMGALAFIYVVGLTTVGLELALLIGLTAGLVSFVPYLGFLVGIVLASVAAFFQFQDLLPLAYVGVVFGIGQLIEGMVLTPLLVGDRIGLHPVAVIFAVLAGGQLFGFFGVLLALPTAAVIMVLLRSVRDRYLMSDLYHT
jgi:predicted PurR-regulated permease PerM